MSNISTHRAICVHIYFTFFYFNRNSEQNSSGFSKCTTSALSLGNREQILHPIYLGRCSHTLHLTLHNSDIVSLSQWFTQPVHQAGIFFWRFFLLFFFVAFLLLRYKMTCQSPCVQDSQPTTWRALGMPPCKATKKPERNFSKHLSNQTDQMVTRWYL